MKKILICAAILCSACSDTTDSANSKIAINVSVFNDHSTALQSHLSQINNVIDNDYSVITKSSSTWGDHHNNIESEIQTNTPTNAIYFVDSSFTTKFLDSDFFEPLDDIVALDEFSDYATQFTQINGSQMLLPIDKSVALSYYRRDVLDQLSEPVTLPLSSWDDFIELGITLKNELGNKLVNNADLIPFMIIENNIPSGEQVFYDANRDPVLTSDRFVNAFNVYKDIVDNDLNLNTGMWNKDWYDSLNDGKAAFEIGANWLAAHLESWIAVNESGKWGVTTLPENHYASMAGVYIGVAKNIDDDIKTQSKEVLKVLLTQSVQLADYENFKIHPSLNSAYNSAELSQASAYLGGDNLLSLVAQSSNLIEPHVPSPVNYVAETALYDALADIESGISVSVALQNAEDAVLLNTAYIDWKNEQ